MLGNVKLRCKAFSVFLINSMGFSYSSSLSCTIIDRITMQIKFFQKKIELLDTGAGVKSHFTLSKACCNSSVYLIIFWWILSLYEICSPEDSYMCIEVFRNYNHVVDQVVCANCLWGVAHSALNRIF